jgi:hypothetical protein
VRSLARASSPLPSRRRLALDRSAPTRGGSSRAWDVFGAAAAGDRGRRDLVGAPALGTPRRSQQPLHGAIDPRRNSGLALGY